MTANELADELKTLDHDDWYEWMTEAAIMLRQQQAEIEALKLRELTDEEIIELFEHPDDFNCIDFAKSILKKAKEK